jgi:hypothetical protein
MIFTGRIMLLIYLLAGLIALLARLHHLDFDSFFMDEVHQASYYRGGLVDVILGARTQSQPPLDYLLGYFVFQINDSDFALRLPAALFGTGSVLLIITLGRRCLDQVPGLREEQLAPWQRQLVLALLGLTAALLPYPIYISQDIRPYSSAIFFCLLQLLVLEQVFRKSEPGLRDFASLALVTLAFLMTRTLSPLVICLVNGLIIFLPWLARLKKEGLWRSAGQKRRFAAQLALLLALLCYLPFFYYIYQDGTEYLRDPSDSVSVWPLHHILQAWTVQFEPLGAWYLPLLILGVISIVRGGGDPQRLPARLLILLGGASVVHFSVFNMMTDWQFLPPYSIYVFPLGLLVGAIGAAALIRFVSLRPGRPLPAVVAVLLALVTMGPILMATADFKGRHIKANWRALAETVRELDAGDSIWIGQTLAPDQAWSPDFYGFFHYPVGSIQAISLVDLLASPDTLVQMQGYPARPRLVLFAYRDYFLTSKSRFSLRSAPAGFSVNLQELEVPASIRVRDFNGLYLLSMERNFGDAHLELLSLLEQLTRDNQSLAYLEPLREAAAILRNGRRMEQ